VSHNWYLVSMTHEVIVYSRAGCHLCDVVKEQLDRLRGRADFTWREVDIDSDPDLRQRYNEEVPVVFVDGRKAFKYHLKERDFLRRLEG
jgi:glutaredoxin